MPGKNLQYEQFLIARLRRGDNDVWEDHKKPDAKTSLKSILRKTTQNRCIDWHRHKIYRHNEHVIYNNKFEYDTGNYFLWTELDKLYENADKWTLANYTY